MNPGNLIVRRVAVLGAGVMGAQIAAHCANADLPVLLFDLPAPEGKPNALIDRAIANLRKLEPAPFSDLARISALSAANYSTDLARLAECDLVIEAIAERIDWKRDLYARVAPHIASHAIFASNTSGLSITALAETLPDALRSNFCGVHFFNPPRYMSLLELIPTRYTDLGLLDRLETWFSTRLGKNVLRAKDTPNFIANRVGVFSMLAVMHHTSRLGLGFDQVDALTGPRIGRPKSATYRTADVVGLDTMAHVIGTMASTLGTGPDADPWHPYFGQPEWLSGLIARGALGQKTRAGVFRKVGRDIHVLDLALQDYRPASSEVPAEIAAILAIKDPAQRFEALRASSHPQADFLWSIFRDVFHYCAWHLGTIADSAQEIDCALRWGFGWGMGPFETWQAAGWKAQAAAIASDIAAGRAMSRVALPAWVFELDAVHAPEGSWAPRQRGLKPRSSLPVYARQLQPERLVGEAPVTKGETLWENGDARDGVRLWILPAADARIGILSFKSKMHSASAAVLAGLIEAVAFAERELDGLVLWHEAPFAVGANLKEVIEGCRAGQFEQLDRMIAQFQRASQALRYALVPTVAAVQGLALGGGCEFVMHAQHRVFALESYVGLVETGVGLIPAGGGCKYLAVRADELAAGTPGGDVFPFLQNVFQNVAMAGVSKSAHEAIRMGYGKASDDVVFNPHELLYVALRRARGAAEAAARPPLPGREIVVAGRNGIAACEMMLVNLREGGMISDYDYRVARALAVALCGGEVDSGARVDEQWLLDVERTQFMELLRQDATQQRITHMLETGKPLRN
jgi:3-hydroxyacyl-CoA dehydrogenase